jgi:hypothetical protein
MVLTGLSPEIIIDIVNRAILFWSFQTSLFRKYQDGVITSYKERLNLLENSYENVLAKSKHEVTALKKKIEGNFQMLQMLIVLL